MEAKIRSRRKASGPMAGRRALSSSASTNLLDDIRAADEKADAAVSAIDSPESLKAKKEAWRKAWIEGIGGLPERTPLNAKEGPVVACNGFTLQNILFESMPGVPVIGHLALPAGAAFKAPFPVVLMPLGHADNGILAPPYAALLAMMARAGFAAFAWDPVSQGERRQAKARQYDYGDNCSTEHTRLGVRGWLVGWNFARFCIWDAMRAIDYVETRRDLDCSKLGVCGTSGGGTLSTYLQALDPRIKVAFPNCYVSSIQAVVEARGCHDAEQFFWNQLKAGVNHAAMLAMGQPGVAFAIGSRWKDYFPHPGAEATFAVFTGMAAKLGFQGPYWHFSCDGPHGLPAPTRAAQRDWMLHCIQDGDRPKDQEAYRGLGDVEDAVSAAPLPFPTDAAFYTATRQTRDLPGFRSLYDLLADRANELAKTREPKSREALRAIVRRRAGILPLAQLTAPGFPLSTLQPYNHAFGWWYLQGAYGVARENEAAILAMLGRSVVGRDAERIILDSAAKVKANGGRPIVLQAKGWDCIAAAHAFAAEPELFSGVAFEARPPSWTELVNDPDPARDSYAIAVWGALEDYDWTELVTG